MNVSHTAATPPGLTVTVNVELIELDRRRLVFIVAANDGIDDISSGTHERFLIDAAKFSTAVAAKAAG